MIRVIYYFLYGHLPYGNTYSKEQHRVPTLNIEAKNTKVNI